MATNEKILEGKLSITRHGKGDFTIEVEDSISGCRFTTISLDGNSLAQALTGLGHVPCVHETLLDAPIGRIAQHKTVKLPVKNFVYANKKALADITADVKKLEINGWQSQKGDITNAHNYVREGEKRFINVVFFRHVKKGANPQDGF